MQSVWIFLFLFSGILKNTEPPSSQIKGILKSSSFDEPPKGILKTDVAQTEQTTKGILKQTEQKQVLEQLEQRLASNTESLRREIISEKTSRTRTISEPGSAAREEMVVAMESSVAMASSVIRPTNQRTDSEDSESGERYSKIKNEAVLRRKMMRDMKKQQDR